MEDFRLLSESSPQCQSVASHAMRLYLIVSQEIAIPHSSAHSVRIWMCLSAGASINATRHEDSVLYFRAMYFDSFVCEYSLSRPLLFQPALRNPSRDRTHGSLVSWGHFPAMARRANPWLDTEHPAPDGRASWLPTESPNPPRSPSGPPPRSPPALHTQSSPCRSPRPSPPPPADTPRACPAP